MTETFQDEPIDSGWWEMLEQIDAEYESEHVLNPNEAVFRLMQIRGLKAHLADVAAEIERVLIESAPSRKFVVPGIGEVQIRKSMRRTDWDNEGLTRVLVAYALDERKLDEITGEYESAHEAVARLLTECSRPSWRVTPLKARGLDPSEFCHEEPDAVSVQLPARGI